MGIKYKRILLKFSGEALAGDNKNFGIKPEIVTKLASDIAALTKLNVQIGLVLGGGNFCRGKKLTESGLVNRVTGDQMGMLATVINSLAFRDAFEKIGIESIVMSAIPIFGITEVYHNKLAIKHLENHKIVIFAAGTGNPLVTTDSAASLRALEINADVFIKATQVDGIYSADPQKNSNVIHHKKLNYTEVLKQELAVMDLNAFIQARDHNLKIIVFNINNPNCLLNIIYGKEEGTIVSNDEK